MARILVVDDSRTVCAVYARALSAHHEVRTAGSGEEALALMAQWPAELALVDINLPGIDGFETQARLRARHLATRTALITDYDVDRYITLALEKDVSNIIVKTNPFDAAELLHTVDNLVNGERLFGLSNYLKGGGAVRTARVPSTAAVAALRDEYLDLLKRNAGDCDVMGLCVVFEEILSNAIYHAHGYRKLTAVTLKPDQVVEVSCGWDDEKCGIAVTDRSGKLTKSTVLKKIVRAAGDEGLCDEDGRGFYLSRAMSDRLVINIESGRRTEIIALKFLARDVSNRPLFINEV